MSAATSIEAAAEQVARSLRQLLIPLGSSDSDGAVRRFVASLGFTLPPGPPPPSILAMGAATKQLVGDLGKLDDLLRSKTGGDETSIGIALAALVADIGQLASDLEGLPGKLRAELPPAFVAATGVDQQLAPRLLDSLLVTGLYGSIPVGARLLRLVGLLEVSSQSADPTHFQPAFTLRKLHWERFSQLFQAPGQLLSDVYGWGTPQLALEPLFDVLQDLSTALQCEGTYDYPSRGMLATLAPGVNLQGKRVERAFELPLVDLTVGQLLALVTAVPKATPNEPQGLAVSLIASGGIPDLDIPVSGHVSLVLDGTIDATAGVAAVFRPGQSPALVANWDVTGSPLTSGDLGLTLDYARLDGEDPLTLVSIGDGSRIDLHEASVGVEVGAEDGKFDVGVKAGVKGGRLLVSSKDSDSFLAKLLPPDGVQLKFDLSVTWSTLHGFSFSGGAALETDLSIDLSLGPITVKTLHLILGVDGNGLNLEASIAALGALGPVSASIDRVGVTADLAFQNGNLGPVDLSLGFKPPSGLGLAIDAGPVSGGGYVYFDPPNGRYAGVLALSLYSVQVKAIGLLDTKLPGGEPGFSFLVVISVEFTPIQLGFGFTLNGVGGLCGINRNFVTDALQAGLRAHSLDHILFPQDPIKNAPAIISDLRTVFPAAEGRYVFGPMLELGWGGGLNLVTAELGVLLSLPSPIVIAILGQISVMLPEPDAAIVELHLDVLGIIDFGKKLFSLDATLHDSRVVVFAISGDMAMRLSWGDDPSFALSVGGLNPHFQPPENFPTLRRLTISLSESDALRLSIQTYFAITSNSFQFGAKAELYAGVSAFNVYGWLDFDALFVFKPFSFLVDFNAGLALRSGDSTLMGISLDGALSGPTPWHVDGSAHVTILFFDISVHVSVTWGDASQVEAPPVDAWPPLQAALQNVQNWSGSLPAGIPSPVTLAVPRADPSHVYVDPNGVLTLRERVLPLGQALSKFGEAVPGPQTTFTLDDVQLGGHSVPFSTVTDKFAPAQFEQMSDQDKLSRPSFDDGVSGFSVGAGQLAFGQQFGLDLEYADHYVDDLSTPRLVGRYAPTIAQQVAWAASSGASHSGLAVAALGKFAPPPAAPPLVTLAPEHFVVVDASDLSRRVDVTAPVSKGEAYRALAAHVAANPADGGRLVVVPLHEVLP